MTIFQLLHWNGSLKALRETKCSRQVRLDSPERVCVVCTEQRASDLPRRVPLLGFFLFKFGTSLIE